MIKSELVQRIAGQNPHLYQRDIENIVNEQCWFIWLPTINAKIPLRNRFGNAKPSVIPHRLIWNIDQVYVKKN